MTEKKEKKKGGIAVLVVVLVLIIAALVVAVVMLAGRRPDDKLSDTAGNSPAYSSESDKRNVVVNEDNIDEILADMADEDFVSAGNYEVTMNTEWNFENGESASKNAYVENSLANTNDVYFDVILTETEEKIYASPLLPIGSHVEGITLDKNLEAGVYDCTVIYYLVDGEQNVLSKLQVGLTINVEN